MARKDVLLSEVLSSELTKYGIGISKISNAENGKWYRIAIGEKGSMTSTCILTFGNRYNYQYPISQTISVTLDGYSSPSCRVLHKTGNLIDKLRVYRTNPAKEKEAVYLDIHVSAKGNNNLLISMAAGIGIELLKDNSIKELPNYQYTEFNIE